ncbi:hypothetical protein [Exiguobacterium sp. s127]|uniref:hypothetical protein n=1 Tax=Exiguobacterium sp. s127 TaxID=2751210 RepID=UPI001BEAD1C6|nr:hypothetical protein [Exiguobacterium sp. s127]
MFKRITGLLENIPNNFWTVNTTVFSIIVGFIGVLVGIYVDEFPFLLFLVTLLGSTILLQLFSLIISYYIEENKIKDMKLTGFFVKKETIKSTSFVNMTIDHNNQLDDEGFKNVYLHLNTHKKIESPIQVKVMLKDSNYVLKSGSEIIVSQSFGGITEFIIPENFSETAVNNIYNHGFRIKPLRSSNSNVIQIYFELYIDKESYNFYFEI